MKRKDLFEDDVSKCPPLRIWRIDTEEPTPTEFMTTDLAVEGPVGNDVSGTMYECARTVHSLLMSERDSNENFDRRVCMIHAMLLLFCVAPSLRSNGAGAAAWATAEAENFGVNFPDDDCECESCEYGRAHPNNIATFTYPGTFEFSDPRAEEIERLADAVEEDLRRLVDKLREVVRVPAKYPVDPGTDPA